MVTSASLTNAKISHKIEAMKKIVILLLSLVFLIILLNRSSCSNSNDFQEREQRSQTKQVPSIQETSTPKNIEKPKLQKTKTKKKDETGVPTASQRSETQEFLDLIARAQSREEVYSTPAKHLIAENIDGQWIAQGDLLISQNQLVEETKNSEFRLAFFKRVNYWPNNTVPFFIDPSLTGEPILEAISVLHRHTNLRFIDHIDETDFIYFKPTERRVCLSYLGRQGGEQEILLNPSYCRMGNILHEIMHALGFVHEHSREDRDEYVNIHWDAIHPDKQGQFQKLSSDISLPYSFELAFDFDSVMLYSSRAFTIGPRPGMTKKDGSEFAANRTNLSFGDVEKINAVYPAESDF